MWAVEKGRDGVIKKCFENGTYLEAEDNDGWTAVMYAARRGNLEIVGKLLEYGADLNKFSKEDKFTALHLAAGNELIDVCLLLVSGGANPEQLDNDGRPPMFYMHLAKNKERLTHHIEATFKDKSCDLIHKRRVELGTEKSVSLVLSKYAPESVVKSALSGEIGEVMKPN